MRGCELVHDLQLLDTPTSREKVTPEPLKPFQISQGWDSNPRSLDYKSSACTAQAPLARVLLLALVCVPIASGFGVTFGFGSVIGFGIGFGPGTEPFDGRFEFDPVGAVAVSTV